MSYLDLEAGVKGSEEDKESETESEDGKVLISSEVQTDAQILAPGFINNTGVVRPSDYAELNASGSALSRTEQEAA
jgi:hypothetical protein